MQFTHKLTDCNQIVNLKLHGIKQLMLIIKLTNLNLDQQLIAIEQNIDLYYCYDYNCKCIDHRIAIDDLCKSLIECCLKAIVLLPYLRLRLVSPRRFQDGMILLSKNVNNLFSGTGYGASVLNHITVIFIMS